VADGRSWSYAEVCADANRLAHALRRMGVGPGTPVALRMSNCAEYVVADQAILRLGAAKVPLNDMLSAGEATYILRDSGAVVALATPSQLKPALEVLGEDGPLHTVVLVDDEGERPAAIQPWVEVLRGMPDTVPEADIRPEDVALIMYTGGTTGRPEGVVHTQRGLADNLLAHVAEMGIAEDQRLLLTSPLPHGAGLLLQAALLTGAMSYVERGFDLDVVLDRIRRDQVTYLFMVPTMIYGLLDRVDGETVETCSLRTILYGAAPITREHLEPGLARFAPCSCSSPASPRRSTSSPACAGRTTGPLPRTHTG
jgi:fatty-acyl-CoA synthase/long-chain acyl-CoA synthetase